MNAVKTTAGLIVALQRAWNRKWTFLVVFLVFLFVVTSVCMATGFVPDSAAVSDLSVSTTTNPFVVVTDSSLAVGPEAGLAEANAGASSASDVSNGGINMSGDLPTKIVIPKVGVNTTVANPTTTNVDSLDSYLLHGAARYPTSATLGQQGNVILFGHSSYLPVVVNQHFKTFDGIQNLKSGDEIDVYSNTKEYVYSVTNEEQVNANSNYQIPLTTSGYMLTLSTCDSFATKSDRFVVTATLVKSYALGN